MNPDRSNGWEAVASQFMAARSAIGAATIRTWRHHLPAEATVLDLGCGSGAPISATLIEQGCVVYGIDASPTLAAEMQSRFPQAKVACEAVEDSAFFDRKFDGVVAIGLLFLLPSDVQLSLIRKVAGAMRAGGRFLFTAPTQPATWADLLTGRESRSLGDAAYRLALTDSGFKVAGEYVDEGGNHYYDATFPHSNQREHDS